MKVSVECFQWRMMSEQQFCHFCVSVERSPMERRSTVLADGIDRQTGREHQADRGEVIVPGGISDLMGIPINHAHREGRGGRSSRSPRSAPSLAGAATTTHSPRRSGTGWCRLRMP